MSKQTDSIDSLKRDREFLNKFNRILEQNLKMKS